MSEHEADEMQAKVKEILTSGNPYAIRTFKYVIGLCEKAQELLNEGYKVKIRGDGLRSRLVIAGGAVRQAKH